MIHNNYTKSEFIDTKIDVDCKIDGNKSQFKISDIYFKIKENLKLVQPFNKDYNAEAKLSSEMDMLFVREMYRETGIMLTFSIYGFYDPLEKNIQLKKGMGYICVSATRMNIQIRTKDASIAEKVKEIIKENSIIKKYQNTDIQQE